LALSNAPEVRLHWDLKQGFLVNWTEIAKKEKENRRYHLYNNSVRFEDDTYGAIVTASQTRAYQLPPE